jgi:hypothetical protein
MDARLAHAEVAAVRRSPFCRCLGTAMTLSGDFWQASGALALRGQLPK